MSLPVSKGKEQPTPPLDGESPIAAGLSFEQAVERLEQIIDRIESGETGLEASLKEYESGMELLRHCRAILARAEQKVQELTPEITPEEATPARGAVRRQHPPGDEAAPF